MGTEWNQPKAPKWAHNLPSRGIRRLDFINRNPGVFGRNVIPEIRKIPFLDRLPEKKGISFDISREKKSSVMACLSKDKRDLYIGADGGINAADICDHLFEGLKQIEQIVFPWDSFHTDLTTDFSHMFQDCMSLKALSVTSFRTSKAIYFNDMFSGCESLSSLDLSSFDTTRVVNFTGMFENCKNLQTLRLGSRFIIRSDAKTDNMFAGCEKLDKNILPKA